MLNLRNKVFVVLLIVLLVSSCSQGNIDNKENIQIVASAIENILRDNGVDVMRFTAIIRLRAMVVLH